MANVSDIDRQIADLMAQKTKLLDEEKRAALTKVNAAIKELNSLGFNYSLTTGKESTRRTGIRKQVQDLISRSSGMTRANVITSMEAQGDKRAQQSISNALAALKKSGAISLKDGTYKAK